MTERWFRTAASAALQRAAAVDQESLGTTSNSRSTHRPATKSPASHLPLFKVVPAVRQGTPAPQKLRKVLLQTDHGPIGLVPLVYWPVEKLVVGLELVAKADAATRREPQEDAEKVRTKPEVAPEAFGQAADLDATILSHRPTSRGPLRHRTPRPSVSALPSNWRKRNATPGAARRS